MLPRLADGAYDLVFVDADPAQVGGHVEQALRLLRPGGLLLVNTVLAGGRVSDPAQRDPVTTAAREALRRVRDDDQLISTLLSVGGGVLAAVRDGESRPR